MSFYSRTNTTIGSVTNEDIEYTVSTNPVLFEATGELEVVITETVDKDEIYYNGDTIIFTITMTRTEGVTKAIPGITLTDTFPDIVNYSASDVETVVGISGSIDVTDKTLTISNITLSNDNPIVEIKVKGTIFLP